MVDYGQGEMHKSVVTPSSEVLGCQSSSTGRQMGGYMDRQVDLYPELSVYYAPLQSLVDMMTWWHRAFCMEFTPNVQNYAGEMNWKLKIAHRCEWVCLYVCVSPAMDGRHVPGAPRSCPVNLCWC